MRLPFCTFCPSDEQLCNGGIDEWMIGSKRLSLNDGDALTVNEGLVP
jgi:hypothetical protein